MCESKNLVSAVTDRRGKTRSHECASLGREGVPLCQRQRGNCIVTQILETGFLKSDGLLTSKKHNYR